MEVLILALSAVSAALMLSNRNFRGQLHQGNMRIASGEKQVDELEAQVIAANERIRLETRRSSELEDELTAVREQKNALEGQLQTERSAAESESQHNAELVSQLRAARREIRELRKVIAKRDEESRLSHDAHDELAEQNSKLRRQLKDAQYALSRETSLRTKVTTERRKYRRSFEVESRSRSELEKQLSDALREVQRLSKDLRRLKRESTERGHVRSIYENRIADLEAKLAETQMELERERAQNLGFNSHPIELSRANKRIAELENQIVILESKWLAQADIASQAVARRKAVEAQIKFYNRTVYRHVATN